MVLKKKAAWLSYNPKWYLYGTLPSHYNYATGLQYTNVNYSGELH